MYALLPNFAIFQFEFVNRFGKRRRATAGLLVHVDRAHAAGLVAEIVRAFIFPLVEL